MLILKQVYCFIVLRNFSSTDFDECEAGTSTCQQKCINVPGQYNCDCYLGFALNADRQTCRNGRCGEHFSFLDGNVPRRPSYGVFISQLIRFARMCSHVEDFNARNKCVTAGLLKQGYRYHELRKAFSKFYRRHYDLIAKFNVRLKSLLHQGLSEPEFYGDLLNKLKTIMGRTDFFCSVSKNNNTSQTYWLRFKCHATVCMLNE